MSKTSAQAAQGRAPGLTRSNASLLQRQNTLGPHVCVQREANGAGVQPHAPALVRDVIESPGRPLDADTRSSMEPHFGYDFSGVRVHHDDRAAESARAVSANAYTAGSHVVFGAGQHDPGTPSGHRLMAHELTHVVQQASGPVEGQEVANGFSVSHPADRSEQEARRSSASAGADRGAASDVAVPLAALPATKPSASRTSVQRADADLSSAESKTVGGAAIASSGVGIFTGLVGAVAAIRSANYAGRSAEAAEDPPSAEPTTGGITVTDADIPEVKGLDLKDIGEAGKDPDSVTETTGQDTEKAQGKDVAETTPGVESPQGEGTSAKKKPPGKGSTTKTAPADRVTKKQSTSKVFKGKDDTDALKTYKVLNLSQGKDKTANADFYASIRSNKKDIKDGGTEPPDATGYSGGSAHTNASVTFKARAGQHNADGSATVRLLMGGTNTPPRKTAGSLGFLGGDAPTPNEHYQVQRFGAVVTFDADPEKRPPVVDLKRLKGGIGTATAGSGDEGGAALVNINLPDTYLPPGKWEP